MDSVRADTLAARHRLQSQGWIARHAEHFRHLPPPAAEVWLGDSADEVCAAHPLAGAGWTLHPLGASAQGRVEARWLDAADAGQRAELLAGLPAPADAGDAAPFAWAHRALCRHGLRLRIGADQRAAGTPEDVVWLQLRHQPRAAVEAPLLVLELQPGAQVVLVERHERDVTACRHAAVQNLQLHLRLGEGARLRHLRVVAPGPLDSVAHHLQARLDRGARLDVATLASGSRYHLQRQVLDLSAERAAARSAGLLLASGEAALEQQVRVAHAAVRTASEVAMLALASGTARAVADAHTRIAPGAADAVARQRLSGIPTGGQPRLVLRPHLEILHDQVQASHGATWGALPEDALFYARQRGLDERSAHALIVEGLAGALLQPGFGDDPALAPLGLERLLHDLVARNLAPSAPEIDHG